MGTQQIILLAWACFAGSILCACGSILALRQYLVEREATRMSNDAYVRTLLRIIK